MQANYLYRKCKPMLLLVNIAYHAYAQPNINRLEYYVDNDPGKGNAINIPIIASADIATNFTVDFTSLAQGVHLIGIRSRDANGGWSIDNRWLFVKPFASPGSATPPNINRVEYYVNTDPGKGLATPITITASNDINALPFTVDISALKQGANLIGVRSRDANGRWSMDQRWLFVKPFAVNATTPLANISYMEYYINTDPGYGNGIKIALTPQGEFDQKVIVANINNLAAGSHNLYIRSRNAQGIWSQDYRWPFTLASANSGTSIVVNSLALTRACLEGSFTMGYQPSGTFNAGNQFIAELSDAAGNFTAPITIGSVSSTTHGFMQVTLPQNIATSNNYKFRIRSTNPAVVGATSSIPIQVYKYNIGADTTVFVRCEFDKYDLTTINTFKFEGGSFLWNTANPTQAPLGNHLIYALSAIGCKDTAAAIVAQEANVWTGSQNNNWFNPNNWSRGSIPTSITHVIVNSGTPNPCVIGAPNATAASIRLTGGATIQVQPGFQLTVVGTCTVFPSP